MPKIVQCLLVWIAILVIVMGCPILAGASFPSKSYSEAWFFGNLGGIVAALFVFFSPHKNRDHY
jgi:hypothetical protein